MADAKQPEKPRELSPLEKFRAWVMQPDHLPSIGRELAYAATDIRQRLVEEAWSGQIQTPHHRENERDGRDPLGRSSSGSDVDQRGEATHEARSPEPEGGSRGIDR